MANLLDRIICDFQDLQKIRQACQCKSCNSQSPINKLYIGNCHYGIYCRKCIEQTNCFLCMSKESPNRDFITLARKSRFRCINYANGCSELLAFDELEEHERNCPLKKVFPSQPKFQAATDGSWYNSYTNASPESPFKKLVLSGQPFFPKDAAKDVMPMLLNRVNQLEKRIESLEKCPTNSLFAATSELKIRVAELNKIQEESFKEFTEKYIMDRDFLWNSINACSQKLSTTDVVLKRASEQLKDLIKVPNTSLSTLPTSNNLVEGGTSINLSPNTAKALKHSNTQSIELVKTSETAEVLKIPPTETEEPKTLINTYPEEISILKKNDQMDEMIAKFQNLSNLVEQISKAICVRCQSSIVGKNPNANSLTCQHCNSFFCKQCVLSARCIVCNMVVCESHSSKCNACERRACTQDRCLSAISYCANCQSGYCSLHVDEHKKFYQMEPFKLNCRLERCKITQGIGCAGMENLTKCLIHMPFLKELRLRIMLIRK